MIETLRQIGAFLAAPFREIDFSDWRDFWIADVLDDRLVIFWFLPLVPLLLLVPRSYWRQSLIAASLVFISFLFGAFYALVFLATCLIFYRLAERFAVECKRTDVLPIGPPLAAVTLLTAWYIGVQAIEGIQLHPEWDAALRRFFPWFYPFGYRGFAWEPWALAPYYPRTESITLFKIFGLAHNIGTAYFAVKMLHYFSDIKRDAIPKEDRTALNFLAYTLYAPCVIQGPIERFQVFQNEMDHCHERRRPREVGLGILRILWGLTKAFFATIYLLPIIVDVISKPWGEGSAMGPRYYHYPETIDSYWLLYFGVFINIYWLYLEFSGYCDVSAGIARIFGYRQIENFNWVWFATSLRDFWRRWHISLSMILRDYLYIPLGGNRGRVLVNLILTFGICGIWHKIIPQMFLWGVIMGVMLWINQKWVGWTKSLADRDEGFWVALRRLAIQSRPLPQIAAWLLTMHAFVFSLLMFFGGVKSWRVLKEIVRRPVAALLN